MLLIIFQAGVSVRTFLFSLLASSSAYAIVNFFKRLGGLGLFLLGALDSSFLVLPFGNDFLLIALVSSAKDLSWILYVVLSALGSLVGVLVIDVIMRKAGQKGLERFVRPKRVKQLKKRLDKHVGLVIFTSTLLPPPFPFTPVIMTASALQAKRAKLFGCVFGGRLLRFTIEALLALYFGKQVLTFLKSPVVDYVMYTLLAIAIVASALSLWKWVKKD
ncbi:MAG TPA: VTT domain-containing protein [Pyrinomonadaceae bacterium]|nr:VTT domain-containing protein [Pyrinomonadaceae bacterium]